MNEMGLSEVTNEMRALVRREAEALVEQAARGMEDKGMEDVNVSDQGLRRYGQQLQQLLAENEQRLGNLGGESGEKLFQGDMAPREAADVPKTNPESATFCDIVRHPVNHVPETNPESATLCDISRHPVNHVSETNSENGTLCDISRHDRSAEAIESYAHETSDRSVDPTDPTTKIDRRQLLAISGLLCGGTMSDTANQIGVNRRTVQRWMHDPKFQAAYRHCEAELRMAAQAQVAGLTEKAVRCVSESLDRGNARVGLELLKLLRVFSSRTTPNRVEQAETRTSLLDVEEEGPKLLAAEEES